MPITISGDSPSFSGSYQGGVLTADTAKASTSGTSVEFTGIPSWAKRITVVLQGVSTNGSDSLLFQLGTSSGYTTSGYLSASTLAGSGVSSVNQTTGIRFFFSTADTSAATRHGELRFTNVTGNTWAASGQCALSNAANTSTASGSIAMSDVVDRVRVTTLGGTNTFDAGSINILYE